MRKEKGGGGCGTPICEHKRSTSVVTRFFQNRRKQILLLNQKKHLHFISLYTLFSPNWKNMLFLLSCGVGGCQRRGVIWAVGGIEMAPAIFSTKDTEHDNRSCRPPDVVIESIVSIAIMTSV